MEPGPLLVHVLPLGSRVSASWPPSVWIGDTAVVAWHVVGIVFHVKQRAALGPGGCGLGWRRRFT